MCIYTGVCVCWGGGGDRQSIESIPLGGTLASVKQCIIVFCRHIHGLIELGVGNQLHAHYIYVQGFVSLFITTS